MCTSWSSRERCPRWGGPTRRSYSFSIKSFNVCMPWKSGTSSIGTSNRKMCFTTSLPSSIWLPISEQQPFLNRKVLKRISRIRMWISTRLRLTIVRRIAWQSGGRLPIGPLKFSTGAGWSRSRTEGLMWRKRIFPTTLISRTSTVWASRFCRWWNCKASSNARTWSWKYILVNQFKKLQDISVKTPLQSLVLRMLDFNDAKRISFE